MVKNELIAAKKFDEIRAMAAKAVNEMLGFSIRHIEINCQSEDESISLTRQIAGLFDLSLKEGNSSNLINGQIEFFKENYPGQYVQIAVGTNFIERAISYFERKGCRFDQASRSEKDGKLQTIYFEPDTAGFAWQLFQN